jgi:hypothetical protein
MAGWKPVASGSSRRPLDGRRRGPLSGCADAGGLPLRPGAVRRRHATWHHTHSPPRPPLAATIRSRPASPRDVAARPSTTTSATCRHGQEPSGVAARRGAPTIPRHVRRGSTSLRGTTSSGWRPVAPIGVRSRAPRPSSNGSAWPARAAESLSQHRLAGRAHDSIRQVGLRRCSSSLSGAPTSAMAMRRPAFTGGLGRSSRPQRGRRWHRSHRLPIDANTRSVAETRNSGLHQRPRLTPGRGRCLQRRSYDFQPDVASARCPSPAADRGSLSTPTFDFREATHGPAPAGLLPRVVHPAL